MSRQKRAILLVLCILLVPASGFGLRIAVVQLAVDGGHLCVGRELPPRRDLRCRGIPRGVPARPRRLPRVHGSVPGAPALGRGSPGSFERRGSLLEGQGGRSADHEHSADLPRAGPGSAADNDRGVRRPCPQARGGHRRGKRVRRGAGNRRGDRASKQGVRLRPGWKDPPHPGQGVPHRLRDRRGRAEPGPALRCPAVRRGRRAHRPHPLP